MDFNTRETGVYTFGPYRLDPIRRVLTRDGASVDLTARLFDILLYLLQHHARVVGRDELAEAVWGTRSMAENNLPVAMSALRKLLNSAESGLDMILTVPGQGYRLSEAVIVQPGDFTQAPLGTTVISATVPAPAARQATPPHRNVLIGISLSSLIAAAGLIAWHRPSVLSAGGRADANFSPPPHSIAVMAFTNDSGDPKQEYFSDGVAEQLINTLGQVEEMHVTARTSSFSFKGKATSVRQIARDLNVAAVLEGSVRRDADRLQLRVKLFDGAAGAQIWSQEFVGEQGKILSMQDKLAEALTSALRLRLTGADAAHLTRGGTTNLEALDADLRGQSSVRAANGSEVALGRSLGLFDAAIALDPSFAWPYAHRAQALWLLVVRAPIKDPTYLAKLKQEGLTDAYRSVALAPELGIAHVTLGYALGNLGLDVRKQLAEFTRARELAPGDAKVAGDYARFAAFAGDTRNSVQAAEQAAALDPLRPQYYEILATVYYYARRPADALVALDHARALGSPNVVAIASRTGSSELALGHAEAARLACKDDSNWEINLCLARVLHELGRQAEAEQQFAKLKAKAGDTSPYVLAQVYAVWGDNSDALKYLQRAYEIHDYALIQMHVDPSMDSIRQRQEFKEIERKLDFPMAN